MGGMFASEDSAGFSDCLFQVQNTESTIGILRFLEANLELRVKLGVCLAAIVAKIFNKKF
jgi:hypothetical protein